VPVAVNAPAVLLHTDLSTWNVVDSIRPANEQDRAAMFAHVLHGQNKFGLLGLLPPDRFLDRERYPIRLSVTLHACQRLVVVHLLKHRDPAYADAFAKSQIALHLGKATACLGETHGERKGKKGDQLARAHLNWTRFPSSNSRCRKFGPSIQDRNQVEKRALPA